MSIGPGLVAYWLSCFKTFTSIIFYYVGQMPPDATWRNRAKRNDKEHHEKAIFFHIAEFWNDFCFGENVFFTPYVICSCRKKFKWNSQKQPFADVLKNVLMFAKNLCSRLFLIKLGAWRPAFLLKKRFQHRCFPVNIAKFLRTAFLWNTFCSLYFYVMIEFFGRLWVQNWCVSYFLYYCFVFLHNSSVRIWSP